MTNVLEPRDRSRGAAYRAHVQPLRNLRSMSVVLARSCWRDAPDCAGDAVTSKWSELRDTRPDAAEPLVSHQLPPWPEASAANYPSPCRKRHHAAIQISEVCSGSGICSPRRCHDRRRAHVPPSGHSSFGERIDRVSHTLVPVPRYRSWPAETSRSGSLSAARPMATAASLSSLSPGRA